MKITVPNFFETTSKPYLLTDFAVANGAVCSRDWKIRDGITSRSGEVWLRLSYSDDLIQTRHFESGSGSCFAGDHRIAVLPCFQDPQSSGFDIKVANLKRVLTLNGQVVLYPQSYVGDELSKELTDAARSGTIKAVGEYASDGQSDDINKPYSKQINRSFNYQGKMYVYVENARKKDIDNTFHDGTDVVAGEGYWFECEPIAVDLLPDGSIQAKQLLLPCQFEPQDKYESRKLKSGQQLDTDDFQIGRFLNGDFLKDLERSVALQRLHGSGITPVAESMQMTGPCRTRAKKAYGVEVIETPMSQKDQIKNYIENGRSFMLHGPSGVGKTRRIEEIDPELTSITLRDGILPEEIIGKTIYPNGRQALPAGVVAQLRDAIKEVKGASDLSQELESLMKGMTVESGDAEARMTGVWSAPYWYARLCKLCKEQPDKKHVLFIDEITNVRPTVQSLVYYIVLNHSIGSNLGKLPENAVVVAAGNSKTESEAAYNMAEPLFRRFYGHLHLDLNINDWLEWGSETNPKTPTQLKVHPIVSAFVASYANNCFYSEYDRDNPPDYALDPRGWEQVSDMVYDNKGQIRRELIANKIGYENAETFLEFAKNPPLTTEDILDDNYDLSEIPDSADGKYALAMSLRHTGEKDIKKVRQFISQQLGHELASTFDSLWVGNNADRAMMLATSESLSASRTTRNEINGGQNDRIL